MTYDKNQIYIYCPECGTKLAYDSDACSVCGATMVSAKAELQFLFKTVQTDLNPMDDERDMWREADQLLYDEIDSFHNELLVRKFYIGDVADDYQVLRRKSRMIRIMQMDMAFEFFKEQFSLAIDDSMDNFKKNASLLWHIMNKFGCHYSSVSTDHFNVSFRKDEAVAYCYSIALNAFMEALFKCKPKTCVAFMTENHNLILKLAAYPVEKTYLLLAFYLESLIKEDSIEKAEQLLKACYDSKVDQIKGCFCSMMDYLSRYRGFTWSSLSLDMAEMLEVWIKKTDDPEGINLKFKG